MDNSGVHGRVVTVDKHDLGQCIRGLMIMFVVIIHLQTGEIYSRDSFSFHYWIVVRQVLNCAVPIFFALSGYFTKREYFLNVNSVKMWWKKKGLKRYIIPFCLWSIIYSIASVFLQSNSISFITVVKLIIRAFVGEAAAPLYFVFVLIQLKLLTPLLYRIISKQRGLILIGVFVLIWDALYYLIKLSGSFNWVSFKIMAPSWVIYYCIGLYYKRDKITVSVFSLLCCLCGAIVEDYIWYFFDQPSSFLVSQLKFTNIVYGIFASLFFLSLFDRTVRLPLPINGLLCFLGNYSYGIYYCHYLVYLMLNSIIVTYQIALCLPLVHLIQFCIVMFLTLLLLKILKVSLGRNNSWMIGM